MDKVICNCTGVTKGQIVKAIQEGAKTVDDISKATDAGTVCGVCISDIEEILEEEC